MNNIKKAINILIAGFGGQGILFTGKLLAEMGLIEGKEVTWMPSYGPAMRGGTCNCSVCVSDTPIGSPVVLKPDLLIVMNTPSYDKFISDIKPGGMALVDSSLVNSETKVPDGVVRFDIPAAKLAVENELQGMANIIMLGKLLKETKSSTLEVAEKALKKIITQSKEHLIALNMKAIRIGYNY
ncbi:MAG: 2-oxoacid:acceptor oxidoreductase family protein [Oscillospiraceae bacterium]|nr:2-oxoacid:acceptor oxidoreductase family protein [Oscillospiraceae bacterium]